MPRNLSAQTFTQNSANNFSFFIKTSLAAVALIATMGATDATAATKKIQCGAGKNVSKTCTANVNKIKGVTLAKQTGRRTCVKGQNWGQTTAGVWTSNGCKGKFNVFHGKLTKAERRKLGGVIGGNNVPAPAAPAHPQVSNNSNHDDLGKGLVVLGGLVIGAAILNEIFDNDQHAPVATQPTTHQPTVSNSWGNHYGNNQSHVGPKRRKRLANICSSALVQDALANGYSNAHLSKITKIERKGNRRFKISGVVAQEFRQQVRTNYQPQNGWNTGNWHNTGWNNTGWNNTGFNWGHNNQPQYVTQTQKQRFTCVIQNGQVLRLNKW